jgi:hypothetical protein
MSSLKRENDDMFLREKSIVLCELIWEMWMESPFWILQEAPCVQVFKTWYMADLFGLTASKGSYGKNYYHMWSQPSAMRAMMLNDGRYAKRLQMLLREQCKRGDRMRRRLRAELRFLLVSIWNHEDMVRLIVDYLV